LQCGDGVWYAFLQLVLDGGRSKKGKIVLDELGSLVQFLGTIPTDGRLGFVVDLPPFLKLILGDLTHSKT
jgi:hypothetical protein